MACQRNVRWVKRERRSKGREALEARPWSATNRLSRVFGDADPYHVARRAKQDHHA
jgi:hypothetical protein